MQFLEVFNTLVQYVICEIFVHAHHNYMHGGQNVVSCMPKYIKFNKKFVSKIILALKCKKNNRI